MRRDPADAGRREEKGFDFADAQSGKLNPGQEMGKIFILSEKK